MTKLDLSSNAIGEVGADALAKGLKENSKLTELDVSNHEIGKVGADALAERLKKLKLNAEMTAPSDNASGGVRADVKD